ncbi:MAG: hypothetical protein QXR53_01335 [Candidatus Norongarragalinales archaeon]
MVVARLQAVLEKLWLPSTKRIPQNERTKPMNRHMDDVRSFNFISFSRTFTNLNKEKKLTAPVQTANSDIKDLRNGFQVATAGDSTIIRFAGFNSVDDVSSLATSIRDLRDIADASDIEVHAIVSSYTPNQLRSFNKHFDDAKLALPRQFHSPDQEVKIAGVVMRIPKDHVMAKKIIDAVRKWAEDSKKRPDAFGSHEVI